MLKHIFFAFVTLALVAGTFESRAQDAALRARQFIWTNSGSNYNATLIPDITGSQNISLTLPKTSGTIISTSNLSDASTGLVTTFSGGTTGLTPAIATSGAVTLGGTLAATSGGTGLTTYSTGDLIYASTTNTLSKLTAGSNTQVLTMSGGVPTWATPTTLPAGTTSYTLRYDGASWVSSSALQNNGTDITTTGNTAVNGDLTVGTALSTTGGSIVLHDNATGSSFTGTLIQADLAASRNYTIPDAGANAAFVMTEGAQTVNGVKTFGSAPVLSAGATISGSTTSINENSNFATNINTGTSTGTVTIGGTGAMTINIGTGGTGAKSITIGDGASTGTTVINSSSGGTRLAALTTNGLVTTSGGNGALSVTTTSAGISGVLSDETGSGALVFGTSPTITTPTITFSTDAAITAGTNAQGQGALTNDYNVITTAANNPSGVTLPTATTGRRVIIVNKGANTVNIYPATGASIDGLAANASISLAANGYMEFAASSTTQWYSTSNLNAAGAAVTTFSGGTTGLTPAIATSGAVTLGGTLAATSGGTGLTTYSTGDLIYASTTNTLSKLAAGSNTQVLTMSGGVPTWATPTSLPGGTTTNSTLRYNGTSWAENSNVLATSDGTTTLKATANQLVLGTGSTTTINASTPVSGSRTYSIPDAGANASFVMTAGTQTIAGSTTFSSATTFSTAPVLSTVTASRPLKVDGSKAVTSGTIDLASSNDVSGILPVANGGTGSSTQNYVDLTTAQASIGGAKTFTSLLTASAGATISGATTSINDNSNNTTNINTGTSTGTVNIGGTGANTINIGAGVTGAKSITIGNGVSTGSTIINAGSGGMQLASLTTNGLVTTSGGNGALSVTTTSAGISGVLSDETGSGALVFGTSPTITTPIITSPTITFPTSATVSAGTNAQGQGALTNDLNIVTTAANNPSGVTLPTPTSAGRRIIVVNKGQFPVSVFPASGGTIDALAANAAFNLPVSGYVEFNASSTTQWYSTSNLVASGATVTSFSAGTTGLTPSTATTGAVTLAGTLAIANGGTGSSTQNFVDLSSTQGAIAGAKTFTSALTASGGATVSGASLTLNPTGTGAGNTNELRFSELAANGQNSVGFKAADNLGANVTWTLPTADGVSGDVLSTNGSGVTSWVTPRMKTVFLSSDASSNATTTFVSITNLETVVATGTYKFEYNIVYQSSALTTGVGFAVDLTGGTATTFVATHRYSVVNPTQTANSGTGGINNTTVTALANGAATTASAAFAYSEFASTRTLGGAIGLNTASVDLANSNMYSVVEGVITVTSSGTLKLLHRSETANSTTVKAGTSLILTKLD